MALNQNLVMRTHARTNSCFSKLSSTICLEATRKFSLPCLLSSPHSLSSSNSSLSPSEASLFSPSEGSLFGSSFSPSEGSSFSPSEGSSFSPSEGSSFSPSEGSSFSPSEGSSFSPSEGSSFSPSEGSSFESSIGALTESIDIIEIIKTIPVQSIYIRYEYEPIKEYRVHTPKKNSLFYGLHEINKGDVQELASIYSKYKCTYKDLIKLLKAEIIYEGKEFINLLNCNNKIWGRKTVFAHLVEISELRNRGNPTPKNPMLALYSLFHQEYDRDSLRSAYVQYCISLVDDGEA